MANQTQGFVKNAYNEYLHAAIYLSTVFKIKINAHFGSP